MRFYWLLLGTLSVWRITHLVSLEDGPWSAVAWIRKKAARGFWADLLDCFFCLSLWVALPFAALLGKGMGEKSCLWLAFSAGAILLERSTAGTPMPTYFEHGGEDDVLLRKSESTDTKPESRPEN